MKRYRFIGIVLLILLLIFGLGLGFWKFFREENGKKEGIYPGKTTVIYSAEEEFAEEIIGLIKEYDNAEISEEALLDPYYSRRLIVQGTEADLDLTMYGAEIVVCGPDNLYVMQFASREVAEEVCAELQGAENIEYCEPDQYAEGADFDSNYEAMSWGVKQIGADIYAKYVKNITDERIVVAVVDSGVYEHSFLKDRIVDGGKDFVDNDVDPDDKHSHGTHVAGTIVDCTPGLNVMILPVRVLGADNMGSSLAISLGIRYAVDQGARVLNLSLSTRGGINSTMDSAVIYAVNNGCTVIAAAGNAKKDTANISPAHLKECIVVSAIDENLEKADFELWGTNWGESVDVAAPGVNVISCVPELVQGSTTGEKTVSMSGTSMATPHISALAAMLKLEFPSLSPSEIESKIISSCTDLGEKGWDPYYGWGIPDLKNITDIVSSLPDKSSQEDDVSVYDDVLWEYKQAADSGFDSNVVQSLQYVNAGAANFMGYDAYAVCYRYADLDGDEGLELLISIAENNVPENIIDIYSSKNGVPVRVIDNDSSIGYRNRYYITADNRIKNTASGGALNSAVTYYHLLLNEKTLDIEELYTYDGWNGDVYTYTDKAGNIIDITSEEYDLCRKGNDVDHESIWECLSEWNNNNTESTEISIKDDDPDAALCAYQGIFMKGDTFISLPQYSSYEPGMAVGIVYHVTKPEWDTNGYIKSDTIGTVGEIYAVASGNGYEIRGEGTVYSLVYYNGKVVLRGNSLYDGTYIQVSNSGANMKPADIWLNFPEETAETEEPAMIEEPSHTMEDSYNEFLSNHYEGCHYAIVNAGENGSPILIITDAPDNILADIYNGYKIVAFTLIDGQVIAIDNGNDITQRMSSGPWYLHENKLYTRDGRGGYYRLDIYGTSYNRVFIDGDDDNIFVDENIVKLSHNVLQKEDPESIAAPKEDIPEYIISYSGNKYLTESEVMALNLSLKEINYAKNEIYARKGRKFRSSELQNYFNSKSWYNPIIEPDDFQVDYLNEYELANAELLSKIEYSLSPNGYQLDR